MLRSRLAIWFVVALLTWLAASCASPQEMEPENRGVDEAVAGVPLAARSGGGASEPAANRPTVTAEPTAAPTGAAEASAGAAPTAVTASPAQPPATGQPVDVSSLQVALQPVATGMSLPIAVTSAHDGSGRLFVLEKAGRIRVVDDGQVVWEPFLDLRDRVVSTGNEQGLLGLAFHPAYEENGTFFVNYTGAGGDTIVSRFQVTGDPNRADPDSEEIVLEIPQPAPLHNGGHLTFGPDGYLWIGVGDGGADPQAAQDKSTLLGSLLRIDVDELPYSAPPDNPFVDDPDAADEIWAVGLRNPWRFSIDEASGLLHIGDVGEHQYEEIDVEPVGTPVLNYGWPIMEGKYCYRSETCDQSGLVLPVYEYDHQTGCSVTGGNVYRGEQFPEMQGAYFFADWCHGTIWALGQTSAGWQAARVAQSDIGPTGFGEGEGGELYVTGMFTGGLYRISPAN